MVSFLRRHCKAAALVTILIPVTEIILENEVKYCPAIRVRARAAELQMSVDYPQETARILVFLILNQRFQLSGSLGASI